MNTWVKFLISFAFSCYLISAITIAMHNNVNKTSADQHALLHAYPESQVPAKKIDEEFKRKSRWHPLCPTVEDVRKAPIWLRQLCAEALCNLGLNHQDVHVINDRSNSMSVGHFDIQGEEILAINLPIDSCWLKTYGAARLAIYHEAAHLKFKDSSHVLMVQMQEQERRADQVALFIANCKQCSLDRAKVFIDCHNQYYSTHNPVTLTLLTKKTDSELLSSSKDLAGYVALCTRNSHPYDLERALNAILFARRTNNLCIYHKTPVT